MKIMLSKALVFLIVVLFTMTSLSPIYAGFDVASKTIDTSEPIEIESFLDTYRGSEISYSFPDKHELEE